MCFMSAVFLSLFCLSPDEGHPVVTVGSVFSSTTCFDGGGVIIRIALCPVCADTI